MGWWLMCLCLLIFFLHSQVHFSSSFSSNSSSIQLCHQDQSLALLHFKNSFSFESSASDPDDCDKSFPKMLSWEEGTDCCSWDGVTCDKASGHVIGLDLSCSQLHGAIRSNSTLFLLPRLQSLNLAFNDFNFSQISSQFGQFASLMNLNLSYSRFSGHIPSEISHITKLASLDLSGDLRLNTLSLKKFVHNLTKLRQLSLDGVNMSTVKLGSLGNLSSSLTSLSLKGCGLRGKFPDNIFHLPNLEKLYLSKNNNLRGYFPKVNWSNPLKNLDISSTSFSGEVPNSIGNIQSLNYLDLSSSNFSGSVPSSLGNLTRVTHLDLSYNHFIGEIPSSLSNLGQLAYLDLRRNKFRGRLPPSIANLTRLGTLALSSNQLVGSIPSQVFQNLNTLDLSNNLLNGTIPSWVFTLPSLVFLDLSYNQLSGHIEIHEFRYSSLEIVWLNNNKLHGPFPMSIVQLLNLTNLVLSYNSLSGIVEIDKFSKLINLEALDLSHNSLSILSTNSNANSTWPQFYNLRLSSCNLSEFPNFLRTQKQLELLDLSINKIQGQIPKWAGDIGKESLNYLNLSYNLLTSVVQLPWENLQILDLHSNLLQGPFPVPPLLTIYFSLSNNKLTGEIPSLICNVSYIDIFDLSNNSLSGVIPECLGNFSSSLSVFDLKMNNFHGTIPQTFAKGNRLRSIDFNGNQLEGPVPRSLINCRNLEVLNLGNNKINDTFPFWLESLPKLQVLVLRSNRLHGSIRGSKAKLSFPKLRIVDLANNDFNGPLPTRFFKNLKAMMNANVDGTQLKYMGVADYYQDSVMLTIKGLEIELVKILTIFTTIDLSNNRFQGEIPQSIGKLYSLRGLNFSHNNLTGQIPSLLENLRLLEALDLSSNILGGEIPRQLTGLTFLAFLNLSQNHLVGHIPQGNQFDTFQNDSYFGNWGLCGLPLSKKCSDDEVPPPPPFIFQEEDNPVFASGFGWRAVLMGYGCGIVFGLGMGYLMFLTRKPEWLLRIIEKEFLHMERRMNKNAHRRRQRRIWQIQAAIFGK